MENAKNYEKIVSKLVENKKNHFEVGRISFVPHVLEHDKFLGETNF